MGRYKYLSMTPANTYWGSSVGKGMATRAPGNPCASGRERMSVLRRVVPDLDHYLAERRLELLAADEWYLTDGAVDLQRLMQVFDEKLAEALARGYDGMR